MCIKELLNTMLHAYPVIATGATISMYICCLLFKPNAELSPSDIGGILLIALISDLSFFIFCSCRELRKKQLMIRIAIHVPIIVTMIVYFAHLWNWINLHHSIEVFVFILLVLGVYASVFIVTFFRDKKMAVRLNDGLKRRYQSK